MDNELQKLIDSETEGLVQTNFFPSYETVTGEYGFKQVKVENLKNIAGNDATVQIFRKDAFKVVRVTVEVETYSEGTLTYQSTYVSPEVKDLFDQEKYFSSRKP
ncbi:MAG: hypothetical protein AB9882_11625 [Ignavibacteriaceae bacterium]